MNGINTFKEGIFLMRFKLPKKAALISLIALLVSTFVAGTTHAQTVTIEPDTPSVGNCYPFGGGGNAWLPNAGFIYQNVPAFSLNAGDVFAFDLGSPNETAIELQIDLVATTVNGGDIPDGSFTTIVNNTQTPTNPLGDDVIGNFELQFLAESTFNFAGGGLIIRFSNPSTAYAADSSCTQVMVYGFSADTSGYFLKRIYRDNDGVTPWDETATNAIGSFQVGATGSVAEAKPVPTMSIYSIVMMVLGLLFLVSRHFRKPTKQGWA